MPRDVLDTLVRQSTRGPVVYVDEHSFPLVRSEGVQQAVAIGERGLPARSVSRVDAPEGDVARGQARELIPLRVRGQLGDAVRRDHAVVDRWVGLDVTYQLAGVLGKERPYPSQFLGVVEAIWYAVEIGVPVLRKPILGVRKIEPDGVRHKADPSRRRKRADRTNSTRRMQGGSKTARRQVNQSGGALDGRLIGKSRRRLQHKPLCCPETSIRRS